MYYTKTMKWSLLNFRLNILFGMSRGTKTEGTMEEDDVNQNKYQ